MSKLGQFLHDNGITQAQLAIGIEKTDSFVSLLVSGKSHPSQETVNALLAFLCAELKRPVKYEELFTVPSECK